MSTDLRTPTLPQDARPRFERRAFSLLELMAVALILGLMASMAVTRFGHETLVETDRQGFARRVALALETARRQSIAEGSGGVLLLQRTSSVVTSIALLRATSGGDVPTEETIFVPSGVTVTSANDRWEFDYTGALVTPVAGGTISIAAAPKTTILQVFATTGHCNISESIAL